MSIITWTTPKGSLGVVPESQYYELQLTANDSSDQPLSYAFLSGQMPAGVYVTRTGVLRGIPTITSQSGQTVIFSFTIRATNPQGKVSDRSFSLTVSNTAGPSILMSTDLVGAWFDGSYVNYQFKSVNENPIAVDTWSIINGNLPPGISLSSDGVLSGYIDLIVFNTAELGYDVSPEDYGVYDPKIKSTDKYFNFTVQATDGFKFATLNVRMLVVSKGNYTADNSITLINNTFITVDADNRYRPIILNDPESLPTLVSGSTFMYKFLAYDPEDEPVSWSITQLAYSGMDQLDYPINQMLTGDQTVGPYTLRQTANIPFGLVIIYNGVILPTTEYTLISTQLTFTSLTPGPLDTVEVLFISSNTGFDSILFDQGASGLPSGLTINPATGWIYGILPPQEPDIVTYDFKINAFRTAYSEYISDPVTFSLNVKRSLNEEIIWNTNPDLGTIDNGAVSELAVSATNTLGKELEYKIIYDPYRKIPQGLKFLSSGRFVGRTSFRYFSLDGTIGWLSVESTDGLEVGMQIQGPNIASGCKITAIVDVNTIEVKPAIVVQQGTTLTFSNQNTTEVATLTSNAVTTSIDGGNTTFDQICKFTVQAEAIDKSISSLKTFTVKVNPYNLAPYENVYLRGLPPESQREVYNNVITDKYIFPPNLIYRPDDPYFGLCKTIKTLFLAGLTPTTAASFVNATQLNHYTKEINFGEVKTAIAKDDNGNIIYEVVYIEAEDLEAFNTSGPPLQVDLNVTNGYLSGTNEYKTIYPNSFNNMQQRVETAIGYNNRGALPRWMTSVQKDGTVLGMNRSVILAYVLPGASELIKYRLITSSTPINGNFSFVSDRYQWDASLSKYYDTTTSSFLTSKQTTFDKYTTAQNRSDVIVTSIKNSVTNSNQIILPDGINVAVGWSVVGQDVNSTIPIGTYITKVDGLTVTLSNNIIASVNAIIKIDGTTRVDYAVSVSFDSINAHTVSYVATNKLIDGVANFTENEVIAFINQQGFTNSPNDGWIKNGQLIPGYLEKIGGSSDVNQRGGSWKMVFTDLPTLGFDDDSTGFDYNSIGLENSYFDQSDDREIELIFVNEVLINQSIKVKSGKTYTNSILTYQTSAGDAVPHYVPLNTSVRTAETTFDGGSCVCREKDILSGRRGIAGGTGFKSNTDKYIVPESLDKYIKFPHNGVFV
ncbi:Putative Ig [uncultured Caudovirales phage]|uniref:Ig n=1 Tax=uncultured Caudovirales phage TaxID=2100421 RepID=A0A6J5LKC5_9CAUD|nr:Putative Ig [uncultured Caudovirales phage]